MAVAVEHEKRRSEILSKALAAGAAIDSTFQMTTIL